MRLLSGSLEGKSKKEIWTYVILRLVVIMTMIRQSFLGNWHSVFICFLTLILFLVPTFFEKNLNIHLPSTLEIIILVFIFSAEILGEIHNFYGNFPYWDTMLHTVNGFLAAAIGFSLIDILNEKKKFHAHLSPLFVGIVAFSFSMTVGVIWEFFEYGMDTFINLDMQKDTIVQTIKTVTLHPEGKNIPVIVDNIAYTEIYSYSPTGETIKTVVEGGYLDLGLYDTMKDLLVNFIGAVIFSVYGMLYIKNRDKYKFAEQFLPVIIQNQMTQDNKNAN